MAFEIEFGNVVSQTDELSDAMAGALVQSVVVLPLIHTEDLPMGTPVKVFRQDGSLTAEAVAESAAYSFSANSELTQSGTSATAAKSAVVSKLTVEAVQFGGLTPATIAMKQGEALRRLLDDDILALFSSFTNDVTATTTLTIQDILQAVYLTRANTAGVSSGPLIGVLDYKGHFEIQAEMIASDASAYTHAEHVSLLGGMNPGNGFKGALPGVLLYETDGLPLDTGDDVGLVYDPSMALAGIVSGSVSVDATFKSSEGFYTEIGSWLFSDFIRWIDAAGTKVKSDT